MIDIVRRLLERVKITFSEEDQIKMKVYRVEKESTLNEFKKIMTENDFRYILEEVDKMYELSKLREKDNYGYGICVGVLTALECAEVFPKSKSILQKIFEGKEFSEKIDRHCLEEYKIRNEFSSASETIRNLKGDQIRLINNLDNAIYPECGIREEAYLMQGVRIGLKIGAAASELIRD